MEIQILKIEGSHPTRASGKVGDHPWIYVSRFGRWSLTVSAVPDGDPHEENDSDWCFTGDDVYMGTVPPDVVERLVVGLLSRPIQEWPRREQYSDVSISAPLR